MASSSDAAFEEELEAMCQYRQGGSSTATDQLELSAPCAEPDHPAITETEEKLLVVRKQMPSTPLLMGAEDVEDLQNEPPPLVSSRQPVLKAMPGAVRATRGSVKQSEEAARKAAKRSLADTVKTRTRGGQANVDDVLEAEALKVEQLPKKKARAAKLEPGAGPSASTRAQLDHHLPALEPSAHPDMDVAAKEQTAERAGTGTASGSAPDGTAVPKRTGKEAKAESAEGGALEVNGHDKGGKKGGAKKEKKKAPGPAPTLSGEIHCHYCGTRESTYWRRGPDGPKTLCNSCGLNWFRQRPMQREQVEKNNLMAKAVAAAQLKRPANSLKEGPEKRKREEKKDGEKLREQLHGKKGVEALAEEMAGKTKGQLQALKKRRKIEEGAGSAEKGGIPRSLKGLKRAEKASIGRKLGDAAVKKAALIKRTPSQLSLMGLLESAAPPQVPEAVPEVVAVKPKGLVKGARFAPLKQAQTRLGAQKLLAVLNVIKQKKGFGRVTSTASLESVPSEQMEAFAEGLRRDDQTQGGEAALAQEWGSEAKDAGPEGVPTPRKTGARSQRRPNTALLQGASFLPWKSRPRGWESSSLTFAAAESRLLKSQAANPGAAAARPPVHKRAEFRPPGGPSTQQEQLEKPPAGGGAPAVQQRGRTREGLAQGGRPGSPASGLSYEGSDADGFAGYDVLRKLLQEVNVTVTSPTSKGRPPLNRAGKMASGAPFSKRQETLERPPGGQARPGLKSYESFEDLVMGTAGGMKRYESFEDLALRAGPAFSRIESFEELALKAGPGIRRFESFEDLAMRSEPVFEVPTLQPPPAADVAVVKGEGGSDADQGSEGSWEGGGRKSGREKKQKTWDWAVVDRPKRKRKEKGQGKEEDQGKLADERSGLATGVLEARGQTSKEGGQSLRVVGQLRSRQGQRLDENGQLPQGGGQSLAAQGPGAIGQSGGYMERPDRQTFSATRQPGAIKGRPQPPARQSILPPGRSVARSSMVPGEAQPTNGQSLSPLVATKGQQIPGSLVGSLGLQNQGSGLGARGLSAMALHLLVDCAVDTGPPAKVNMLMQDLETLAIGNPALFESRRTLQGNGVPDGSELQAQNGATFALSHGQTFKQQALQLHAMRPLVRAASSGREQSVVGGSGRAVGSEGLAAGPLSEGGKGNSGAATISTPEVHRPVATVTMREPAKPVQTPQGAPGEPELHCPEELASPEDNRQYAAALPSHVPPFNPQQEPGH